MTRARRELVSLEATSYYHCVCRCVRRAFLCGEDSLTGKNYEHRKHWVIERLRELQQVFAVDICAYAVMSNHYHLVVRLAKETAESWTEAEVIRRWGKLFSLPVLVSQYQNGKSETEAEKQAARKIIAQWRERLADLSWYMRCLNEHLARRANEEDGCTGRFWEGRFRSQALLDEAAVLTCMSYVDLNPVRAAIAQTPEESDFTSIQQRIAKWAKAHGARQTEVNHEPVRLMPMTTKNADRHIHRISFSTRDYLELVDWAGRAVLQGKRGAIPGQLPKILQRLNLDPVHYLRYMKGEGRGLEAVVLGQVERIREVAAQLGRKFLKGQQQSKCLYLQESRRQNKEARYSVDANQGRVVA